MPSTKYAATVAQGSAGYTWDAGTLDATGLGADDADYALCTGAGFDNNVITNEANLSNFSMAVPAGCTIRGIVVEINRARTTVNTCVDYTVQLTKTAATPIGNNLADTSTAYPQNSDTTAAYGSATDLSVWGVGFTAAEVNATGFGLQFRAQAQGANVDIRVNFIRITVYYTLSVSIAGTLASSGAIMKAQGKALAGALASAGAFALNATNGWEIQRKAGAGEYALLAWIFHAAASAYQDSGGLSNGTRYTYRIRQWTADAAGEWSNEPYVDFLAEIIVTVAGALATAGALVQSHAKSYAGTLATAGTLIKVPTKALAGTLATAGVLAQNRAKQLAGALATSGGNALAHAKTYAGTLATSGEVQAIRQKLVSAAGTLASTGTLGLSRAKQLAGTLATSGAVQKARTLATLAGSLATAGALDLLKGKIVTLAGTLATSGTTALSHTLNLAGALATSGVTVLSHAITLAGTLASGGALTIGKAISVALSGTLTTSGALMRTAAKQVAGTLVSSGVLQKARSLAVAGVLTTAGAIALAGVKTIAVAGELATSGALVQSLGKTLSGVLDTAGSLTKAHSISLAGTLTTSGEYVRRALRRVAAQVVAIAHATARILAHGNPTATVTPVDEPTAEVTE